MTNHMSIQTMLLDNVEHVFRARDLLEALWVAYHMSERHGRPAYVFRFTVRFKDDRSGDYWFVADERHPTRQDAVALLPESRRKQYADGGAPHFVATVDAEK